MHSLLLSLKKKQGELFFSLVFLGVVLFLAALLRFWNLGSLPQGFHNDEVMNGYIGRYILENGKDVYGNPWPLLYFDNFGDFPNVIPMYLSGFFTFIFGINEMAVRFPIALFGVATVAVVYALGRWLWKPPLLAAVAASVLAIMPWHIVLSRATAEGITASCIFLLGILWIFQSISRKNTLLMFAGWLCLVGTFFLYPGFRVFAPLSLLPGFFIIPDKKQKRFFGLLTVILFSLTFAISQTPWGKGRFDQTSLFTHNQTIQGRAINYGLGLGQNRVLEARIFHNKYLLAGREFFRQYTSYFSPEFLLMPKGEPPRYSVPEHGALHWSFVVVIGAAFIKHLVAPWKKQDFKTVFQTSRMPYFGWLLWIFLIAPLPAALTLDEVPNIHRTVVMAPLWAMLIAFAAELLAKTWPKRSNVVWVVIAGAFLLESIHFWHYYQNLYSLSSSLSRSDEQKTLSLWLIEHQGQYETIYAPVGELLPIHYLFHLQRFPGELAGKFSKGMEIESIDSITFIDDSCPSETLSELEIVPYKAIVVDRSDCKLLPGYNEVGALQYFNQLDAYSLRAAAPN